MNIEEVYGFIRSEDAVLWVGTGFSLYANYPSGKALADQINANLPDKEKETDPRLMEIAYKYELINGRKQLIEFLSQIIEATPFSDEKWHKELALIPHIKTIITTNYDNLFEKNYGDKCVVIRTDADIKNIDENKTAIFKIHGDFLVPDKLIITRDDYAKWLGEFPKTPLYNLVVSRLITKSVIFLGYSIEDINALTLINTINSQLGENRRQWFYVSPDIPDIKVKELQSKNITAIPVAGEQFIENLTSDLNNHVLEDITTSHYGVTSKLLYAKNRDVNVKIEPSERGYKIAGLALLKKDLDNKLTFNININTPNAISAFLNHIQSKDLVIPASAISDLEYKVGPLLHPYIKKENISEIILTDIPFETTFDIRFSDIDFDYNDIPVKIYRSNNIVEIFSSLNVGTIYLKISLNNVSKKSIDFLMRVKRHDQYRYNNTSDELKFHKLISLIFQQYKFRIISGNYNIEHSIPVRKDEHINFYTKYMNFFTQLRFIERKLGVAFKDYTISEQDIINVKDIYTKLVSPNYKSAKKSKKIHLLNATFDWPK